MAGIKPEKRLHPRRSLQVPVLFQKRERSHWGMSEDIGRGGLFLTSFCPPDPGEDLEIHLADPRAGEPMVLRGKVVHRREGTKAAFLLEKLQRPAGVGIAFEDVSPIQEERLGALLSEDGSALPQGEATPPCPEAEGEEGEAREAYQVLEDPAEIRRVLQALCKKIRPVLLKRLGGRIHYTTYFRDVIGVSVPFRVEAEAVGLKDFDSVFFREGPLCLSLPPGGVIPTSFPLRNVPKPWPGPGVSPCPPGSTAVRIVGAPDIRMPSSTL